MDFKIASKIYVVAVSFFLNTDFLWKASMSVQKLSMSRQTLEVKSVSSAAEKAETSGVCMKCHGCSDILWEDIKS